MYRKLGCKRYTCKTRQFRTIAAKEDIFAFLKVIEAMHKNSSQFQKCYHNRSTSSYRFWHFSDEFLFSVLQNRALRNRGAFLFQINSD